MRDDDLSGIGFAPPPRKEDILFPRRSCEEQKAYVNITQGLTDWIYGRGFRVAAHHLAKQMSDTGTEHDFLIYPIVYLYRHHAELVLKAIITSASRLLDHELTKHDLKMLGRHDLWELWQATQSLLKSACKLSDTPPFPIEELEGVASYIRQIHEHDPDGQRFRYATTKTRETNLSAPSSLSPDLTLGNVMELASFLEKLADYLDRIEGWCIELESAKAEYLRIHEKLGSTASD